MNIAIGCDEAGFQLKKIIMQLLKEKNYEVTDYGCYSEDPVLYPDEAYKVSTAVAAGKHERGILICGTGMGMCITANKVPGIRATVCHDVYSAIRSRRSNNAQILCLGARVIGTELAKEIVKTWLENDFVDGPSTPKVNKIMEIEARFLNSQNK